MHVEYGIDIPTNSGTDNDRVQGNLSINLTPYNQQGHD